MLFLDTLFKKQKEKVPLWLMRQAGRYLPEYRKVRQEFKSFWDLVFCPEAACEITLQPLKRFDFDAAILFSDILVTPKALGQTITFDQGVHITPFKTPPSFEEAAFFEKIKPILETIKRTKSKMPQKPLIGFSGGIFSTLCYVFKEEKDKNFEGFKKTFCERPDFFHKTQEALEKATLHFLSAQIEAGVDALQIFESWGGLCPWSKVKAWLMAPTKRLVTALKKKHPNIPLILFTKGCGHWLEDYSKLPIDAFSLDIATPFRSLHDGQVFQGNLDPALLYAGGVAMEEAVEAILKENEKRSFIFNLGHGILPETPIQNVEKLVSLVRRPCG